VSDIELLDLRYRRNRTNVLRCQSMPGVHRESDRRTFARRDAQSFEPAWITWVMRVLAGVKLHCLGAELPRKADRLEGRVDKETHADTAAVQSLDRARDAIALASDIESPLCRHLLAFFRNQCDLLGFETKGNVHHLIFAGRLEVEVRDHRSCELFHVRVLYVAAILSKMSRDSVGARRLAEGRGLDRIGLVPPPRLSQCRDMVYVDIEALMSCCHLFRPVGSQQLSWSTE
jgi:hypothetical protein